MQQTALTAVFLPLALAVIMLGLGLSLTPADFRRVVQYPRAVAVGLLCQTPPRASTRSGSAPAPRGSLPRSPWG